MWALGSFRASSPCAPVDMGWGAAGGAHSRRLLHCPLSRAACAARRVTLRGLVSESSGPKPGGAGGFFAKLSPSLRSAKSGRPDSGLGQPVVGRTASRTPRRTGAESWVFAGKMRVSVQLAYKVPVLGPQDRHFLHAPRCPKPAPSWSSCSPAGPPPPMSSRVESTGKACAAGICAVSGESLASAEKSQRA